MKKIHYSGGVVYEFGNRLPGWPVCMTSEMAETVRRNGNQTDEPDDVTCKACNKLIDKQIEYRKAHPAYWLKMKEKGYCT